MKLEQKQSQQLRLSMAQRISMDILQMDAGELEGIFAVKAKKTRS